MQRPALAWLVLAAAWSCAAFAPAAAQSQATPRAGKPLPRLLSRAELRVCLGREQELKRQQDALQAAHDAHNAEIGLLSEEARRLADELKALDVASALQVDDYNRRNDVRNKQVEKANARADALRQTSIALRDEEADYMKACVARPYLLEDRDAVLKELGRNNRKREQHPEPARTDGPGRTVGV